MLFYWSLSSKTLGERFECQNAPVFQPFPGDTKRSLCYLWLLFSALSRYADCFFPNWEVRTTGVRAFPFPCATRGHAFWLWYIGGIWPREKFPFIEKRPWYRALALGTMHACYADDK